VVGPNLGLALGFEEGGVAGLGDVVGPNLGLLVVEGGAEGREDDGGRLLVLGRLLPPPGLLLPLWASVMLTKQRAIARATVPNHLNFILETSLSGHTSVRGNIPSHTMTFFRTVLAYRRANLKACRPPSILS
jgi:hypothetical protein